MSKSIKQPNEVGKRDFIDILCDKLKFLIHSDHITSIVNIIFEELISDLKQGKVLDIINFGKLFLVDTAENKKFFDLRSRQMALPKMKRKKLQFTFDKQIRKEIVSKLDIDKTFPEAKLS